MVKLSDLFFQDAYIDFTENERFFSGWHLARMLAGVWKKDAAASVYLMRWSFEKKKNRLIKKKKYHELEVKISRRNFVFYSIYQPFDTQGGRIRSADKICELTRNRIPL